MKLVCSICSLLCLLALCAPATAAELNSGSRRLLQKNGKKVKKPKEPKVPKNHMTCNGPTLQLIEEHDMDTSFPNTQVKRFEGSDLVQVDDNYYVVFDNLYNVGRIGTNLSSADNYLLPHRWGVKGASGYEAIAYDRMTKQFFVVVESVPGAVPNVFHGMIEQLRIDDEAETTQYISRCATEFVFDSANKGFEGAAIVRAHGGRLYMLALCEGNSCKGGNVGKDKGHGKIIVMTYHKAVGLTPCLWKTVREMSLPATAFFEDYSALALRRKNNTNNYEMAVTSQTDSQLWLGELHVGTKLDLSDWNITMGRTLDFPRGPNCAPLFCSVEGVGFLHNDEFVAVSDVGGGTAASCTPHDQSVHVFKLPA